MGGRILFQAPQEGIYEMVVVISLFPHQALLLMPRAVPRLGHITEELFNPSYWVSTALQAPSSLY